MGLGKIYGSKSLLTCYQKKYKYILWPFSIVESNHSLLVLGFVRSEDMDLNSCAQNTIVLQI